MRTFRYLSLAILAVLAACAPDATTPTVDVSALADQMSGAGGATYSSAALSASVPGVAASVPMPAFGPMTCPFSTANQRFECAPQTANGLTFTRSFAALDATGKSLSTPTPTTVAAIRTITDVKGTMTAIATGTVAPPAMSIDRHEDATMSGLQSATHVMNGTSTQKLDFTMTGTTYSSTETGATANLQLPLPTATSHWPLGGTITTDRSVTLSGQAAPMTSHEVLTFDGTSVMTLKRTAGTVTMTCKFDLAKPGTPPACT